MNASRVRARPAIDAPGMTVVTLYSAAGYDGHAVLDEDGTRRLRDELNQCLTGLHTTRMVDRLPARYEGSE
jgi:hypothetical protein